MKTPSNGNISALLALCAGNSSVPVNSPHKGQWRGALMFSLICAWINDWINNRETGDLRRHRGHYDVNVMEFKLYAYHIHYMLPKFVVSEWCFIPRYDQFFTRLYVVRWIIFSFTTGKSPEPKWISLSWDVTTVCTEETASVMAHDRDISKLIW